MPHFSGDLLQEFKCLGYVGMVFIEIFDGAIEQVVLFITSNFQDCIAQIVCDLNNLLFALDFPQVVIGDAADGPNDQHAQ